MLDENQDLLRGKLAKVLNSLIEELASSPPNIRTSSINKFIENSLGCEIFSKESRAQYVKNDYGEAALLTMSKFLKDVCEAKFPIRKKFVGHDGGLWVESTILNYLNGLIDGGKIDIENRLEDDFFRKFKLTNTEFRDELSMPQYICEEFYKSYEKFRKSDSLIDSSGAPGIFMISVISLNHKKSSVESICIADLLPCQIDQLYLQEISRDRIGGEVDIRRVKNSNLHAPLGEIRNKIIPRYLSNDELRDSKNILDAQIKVIGNLAAISANILIMYITHIDFKLMSKINSGQLIRFVFDVQYGAICGYSADEGAHWVVSFNPREKKVSDGEAFMKKLVQKTNL